MSRKKAEEQDELLSHPIIMRVTEKQFKKLEEIQRNSNCQSLGEVVRKILGKQRILYFHKDITMNGPMEELATIRKELRAIGININQLAKGFNTHKRDGHQALYMIKAAEQYQQVDKKVDQLLLIVAELTSKWLQK